ncbi:DUF2521 family protein [Metabacillus indicus]|uniref:DUF2521 family protein n=1 Tax=Metabacillus indicus TaxID=246786 RepID=UPI003CF8E342
MEKITSLSDKRREKQINYERIILKELTLTQLKAKAYECFGVYMHSGSIDYSAIEEGCIDYSIEAFLLGASYSRFGYYGEPQKSVSMRSSREEKELTDQLFDYMLIWGNHGDDFNNESVYYACEHLIHSWWSDGFEKGAKRLKLRLH